jgi:hypothetical protein
VENLWRRYGYRRIARDKRIGVSDGLHVMTDPVVILIFLPWLVGPLLVRRYDLWRGPPISRQQTADGFMPVNRKLMRMQ